MKKIITLLLISLPFVFIKAQTTITTAMPSNTGYAGENNIAGNAAVTFVVQNTNGYTIKLKGLETVKSGISPYAPVAPSTFYLWYSATSLSDTAIMNDGSWTKIDSVSITTLITGYNNIFSNLNFSIPGNTTYRFALQSTSGIGFSGGYGLIGFVPYPPNIASPSTLSANGINLILGTDQLTGKEVGWVGNAPFLGTRLAWFTGSITFSSTIACTSPPVAGNTISTNINPCVGVPFTLNISGNTQLASQTYQWQSSLNGTSWTNIAGATTHSFTTTQSIITYYRCSVTCSGNTSYATPLKITTAAGVSGTFTINNIVPTSGSSFQTFAEAINYISCGISGPVVFNVVAGSGPYYEQVVIPFIGGTSSTNTITFNGNGETILFNNASDTKRAVLT